MPFSAPNTNVESAPYNRITGRPKVKPDKESTESGEVIFTNPLDPAPTMAVAAVSDKIVNELAILPPKLI